MDAFQINAIAAMDRNRVIGKAGALPWRLREDLARFRKLTMGKPIILGRVTLEGLGKPLDGRPHIVLSRGLLPKHVAEKVTPAFSLQLAIDFARMAAQQRGVSEAFVIGGAQVYAALMPWVRHLYLTQIDEAFEGDAFFPEIDPSQWHVLECTEWRRDPETGLRFRYLTLDRRENAHAA